MVSFLYKCRVVSSAADFVNSVFARKVVAIESKLFDANL